MQVEYYIYVLRIFMGVLAPGTPMLPTPVSKNSCEIYTAPHPLDTYSALIVISAHVNITKNIRTDKVS